MTRSCNATVWAGKDRRLVLQCKNEWMRAPALRQFPPLVPRRSINFRLLLLQTLDFTPMWSIKLGKNLNSRRSFNLGRREYLAANVSYLPSCRRSASLKKTLAHKSQPNSYKQSQFLISGSNIHGTEFVPCRESQRSRNCLMNHFEVWKSDAWWWMHPRKVPRCHFQSKLLLVCIKIWTEK